MGPYMAFIMTFLIGGVCIFLGIRNMQGDISSLHSYHRNRVSEEDRPAFGKEVGLGTIIVGSGVVAYSILSCIAECSKIYAFLWIGTAILIIGLVAGLILSLRAMIKYNKGIF